MTEYDGQERMTLKKRLEAAPYSKFYNLHAPRHAISTISHILFPVVALQAPNKK